MLTMILRLALKVALVLLVAALAARALRGASAASRHLAWTLGLVAVLLVPLASMLMPAWRIPVPVLRSSPPASARVATDAREALPPRIEGAAIGRVTRAASPEASVSTSISSMAQQVRRAFGASWDALALLAWAVGSLVALTRLLRDVLLARALSLRSRPSAAQAELDELALETGAQPSARLRESREVSVPMTFGALPAAILVPEGFATWDLPRRREVLLHELAHVVRHDWSASLLARFAKAVFWFHPIVHLAERHLRAEAEQAADDLVLSRGTRASSYAAHLLGFARAAHPASRSSAMTLSMIGGPLDQRIHALLDAKRARGPVPLAARLALGAGAMVVMLTCSAVTLQAAPMPHGAWDHVTTVMNDVFGGTPSTGSSWYSRGMRLHESGQHAEAIECWKKSIAADHAVGAATYNIACAHAMLGHAQEALDSLEKSVELGFDVSGYLDDDDDLASLRGNSRFEALRARHSDESSVRAMLRVSPSSANGVYNEACAHALAGRRAEAFAALERSIEMGFADADHAADDSDLESLHGDVRFPRMLADMRAVELPSRNWMFGRNGAVDRDDWTAARDRHQKYLELHPTSGHAWSNLGYIQLGLDAVGPARNAYERAAQLNYAPGQTAYNLACAHARAGETDAAFAALDRASSAGFSMGGYLGDDDDLDSLRDDPRFAALKDANPSPMHEIHERVMEHVHRLMAL